MSATTPILLERDNVNDESVTLVHWAVEHGGKVELEMLLAEVETSKASVEVYAQTAGYLQWGFPEGSDVPVSSPIGYISADPLSGAALVVPTKVAGKFCAATNIDSSSVGSGIAISLAGAFTPEHLDGSIFASKTPPLQRFSRLAEKMMREYGLTPAHFADKTLVRKQDILELLNPPAAMLVPGARTTISAALATKITQPHQEIPLSKMKRFEGAALAAGVANAVPSSVSVTCFTKGLRNNLKRHPMETGNLSAVIIYEVGRLLRKYPTLNSTYRDGTMLQYERVDPGFALDDGRGLKVVVFQNADQLSLRQVADRLIELTTAYVQNKLAPAQISNATFTISDLSGLGVSSLHPLISENQSGVLGISGEQFAPESVYGFYTMTLTFDHQLSDGRTAARFLNDLKKRLQTYESATAAEAESSQKS